MGAPIFTRRPRHLARRQVSLSFGEKAVHIMTGVGSRDDTGEWVPGVERRTIIDVSVASTRATRSGSGISRLLEADGIRTEDIRVFWTDAEVSMTRPMAGPDEVEWPVGGDRYRILGISEWDNYREFVGVKRG